MSTAGHTTTKTNCEYRYKWMAAHYDVIHTVIEAVDEEPFTINEIPQGLRRRWKALVDNNILKSAGADPDAPMESPRKMWTLDPKAVQWIGSHKPNSPQMPCGHHGISNIGGSYGCCEDWCDERFSRREVKANWESE